MEDVIKMMSPQDALVASMILMSAVDRDISDLELREITTTIDSIPAFRGYDTGRLRVVSASVVDLLQDETGLDAAIGLIREALTDNLRETAYALACDIAAADGVVGQEEIRLLELMRHGLGVDRLIAAGIERGSRARHQPATAGGAADAADAADVAVTED